MAINVVIEDPQLTVLGPPASLTLNVNSGEQGTRGTKIFSGVGNPNSSSLLSDKILGDLFVRTDIGPDYGVIYQYVSVPGGPEWQKIINFQPIRYNAIVNLMFAGGSGSVSIPLSNFYIDAPAGLTANNLVTQVSAQSDNPTAVGTTKLLTSGSTRNIILYINAAEFVSASWSYLSGSANFNVGISVI
jgi:hypothetical protein